VDILTNQKRFQESVMKRFRKETYMKRFWNEYLLPGKTDGFNENQIETKSKRKGEHCIGITMVVSHATFRINWKLSDSSWESMKFKAIQFV